MKFAFLFLIFICNIFAQDLKILKNITNEKNENSELIKAGFYEQIEPNLAYKIYANLYKTKPNDAYLKKLIILSYMTNNKALHNLLKKSKNLENDESILRIKIASLLYKDPKYALQLSKKLLKISKNLQNLALLGESFLSVRNYKEALRVFTDIYKEEPNEFYALKIAMIYEIKLKDLPKSIEILENFTQNFGCSVKICSTLFEFYTKEKQYKKGAEILQELYKIDKKDKFIETAAEIYIFLKDYENAIKVLEINNVNTKFLLDIYAYQKKFKKAYEISKKEFEKTKNEEFKILMAIYEYEGKSPNLTKQDKNNITKNFEKSVQKSQNPIYLNYYGYFLIDNEIDIKKGINLIKQALKIRPDESYIIDSLAWGYYKNGECQNAKFWMEKASQDEEFMKSEEAKIHFNKIINCK